MTRWQFPPGYLSDPFTPVEGLAGRPWLNLPSVLIMVLVTTVLVLGIRESVRTNAILVMIKLVVVLVVIAVGWAYVQPGQLDRRSLLGTSVARSRNTRIDEGRPGTSGARHLGRRPWTG